MSTHFVYVRLRSVSRVLHIKLNWTELYGECTRAQDQTFTRRNKCNSPNTMDKCTDN